MRHRTLAMIISLSLLVLVAPPLFPADLSPPIVEAVTTSTVTFGGFATLGCSNSSILAVNDNFPTTGSGNGARGQGLVGFTLTQGDMVVQKATFSVWKRVGSPTISIQAAIFAATRSQEDPVLLLPTGDPLDTSNSVDAASLGSATRETVTFSFVSHVHLASGGNYALVLRGSPTGLANDSNYVQVCGTSDTTSNHVRYAGNVWSTLASNSNPGYILTGDTVPTVEGPGTTPETGGVSGFLETLSDTVTSAISGGTPGQISPVVIVLIGIAVVILLRPKGKRR